MTGGDVNGGGGVKPGFVSIMAQTNAKQAARQISNFGFVAGEDRANGRGGQGFTQCSSIFHASLPDLAYHAGMLPLTNAKIRELKARAQLMKPTLKVGHDGLSEQFIAALDTALKHHDLVKVKFSDFKEQKKELAPQLAAKTGSELIMRVGNVAVLYRPKPEAEKVEAVDEGE
jgi:RNA-binding protein